MLQVLLPIAFRDMVPDAIWEVQIELSYFFKDICSQVLDLNRTRQLREQIVETLCKLEKFFPPGFFDIIEHLLVHLPYEAELGGPVQYRWMYPFERFLHGLKMKVGNKAHVEASICEAYLVQETSTFCSLYFEPNVVTRINRVPRNDDGGEVPADERLSVFRHPARGHGVIRGEPLRASKDIKAAHTYILLHTPELSSYLRAFENDIVRQHPRITAEHLEKLRNSQFALWLKNQVLQDPSSFDQRIYEIAMGPSRLVKRYNGCFSNGFNFHTYEHGSQRMRANSGVNIKGSCGGGADSDYYGMLEEIWELVYQGDKNSVVLFKCHWYDTTTKMHIHQRLGLVELDPKSRYPTDELFVLASQALQVFYMTYPGGHTERRGWWAVCKGKSKGRYEVSSDLNLTDINEVNDSFQVNEMQCRIPLDQGMALDEPGILASPGIADEVDLTELVRENEHNYPSPSNNVESIMHLFGSSRPPIQLSSQDNNDMPIGDDGYSDVDEGSDDAHSDIT